MRYLWLITALVASFLLQADLSGQEIDGELKQWCDVSFVFDRPDTRESADPNRFLDCRLNVVFAKRW